MSKADHSLRQSEGFEDFLPVMAEKLGGQDFVTELCNGFNMLADPVTGSITFESLKRNAARLGVEDMSDEELKAMIVEGDFDADGALNLQEFCILMIRMSPHMMDKAEEWLECTLAEELQDFMDFEGFPERQNSLPFRQSI